MCLGLACGAKIFALVLVPFVLIGATIRHWVVFGATLAALYAPFALGGGTDLYSLLVSPGEWEFNAAAFGLLTTVLPAFEAKLGLGLVWPCAGASIIGGTPGRGAARSARRLGLRRAAGGLAGHQSVVSALGTALCGDFPQRMGLDGLHRDSHFVHHRTQCE